MTLQAFPDDFGRVLAIVAHPDDLEYGAAAAVARWTAAGKHVGYLLVTRGEAGIDGVSPEVCAAVREREQRASAAAVGVRDVEFLGHPDGVIEYGVALRRDLTAAIRRFRPEGVVTLNHRDTWGGVAWNSPDHRAVGRAVLDAAGDADNRWIFPEAGDRHPVRWVAVAGSGRATHAVDVAGFEERAVASLLCHRAYIEGLTEEEPERYARSVVGRGLQAGAERFGGRPAVAFELFPR